MTQIDPNKKLKILGWWLHGLGALVAMGIATFAQLAAYQLIDDRTDVCVRQTDELQTVLREEDAVRAKHAQFQQRLAAARQEATMLQARVPDEPREANFLAQVSRLAGRLGLRIDDYRPGAITLRPSYSELQVDLICKGDYTSISSFLDQLSKLPRHCTIARLQVETDRGRPEYSAKISVTLYFAVQGRPPTQRKEMTHA